METKNNSSLFLHPAFISALIILLLNDHFLKYTYPGLITGKLSDFTGLFVFHLFLLQLFPAKAKQVTLFLILFFVWWKSPLSQMVIDFFNSFQLFVFQRVIDYSDLLALPVLFLSWKVFYQRKIYRVNFYPVVRFFVFSLCIYSFFATSMIKTIYIAKKRTVKHTPEEIINGMIRDEFEFKIDTLTTAAKYTYYLLVIPDTRFTPQNITEKPYPGYQNNLTLTLFPQSKKRTRMEASLKYPYEEPFISSKDSLRKSLKNWLKQFE